MRSKAILMALLALAFSGAEAASVSGEKAASAARAWAYRGRTLGARVGTTTEKVATHRTANGVPFYAVKMKGGGTVFMSADTEVEPVIAFTGESADFSEIDPKSPLWALLNRDLSVRGNVIAPAKAAAPNAGAVVQPTSGPAKLWAKLLAEGAALDDPTILKPARADPIYNPGDLRVPALVKSQWNQAEVGNRNCYNYYTPNNYVCGCVATAMSQLMRYHRYPDASWKVPQVTRKCFVDASTTDPPQDSAVELTTQGGFYDWANMPLTPSLVSEVQAQDIGKLTSDAGIAVYMSYEAGGSGAFMPNVPRALMDVFGFKNAVCLRGPDVTQGQGTLERALFSNFDAGCPVLLGISGAGGHAIVADGYGYNYNEEEDTDIAYVHLNMGWSGMGDMWYNLPDMTAVGYSAVDEIVLNAFPTNGVNCATFSGRVLDDDGNPVPNARVVIRRAGENDPVAELTTSASGVYGVILPAGKYDVKAMTPVGEEPEIIAEAEGVTLSQCTVSEGGFSGWIVNFVYSEYYSGVPFVSNLGNSWGNDMKLNKPPTVRIGDESYSTLDKALKAAAGMVDPVLEIIDATTLSGSRTINFSCSIVSSESGTVRPVQSPTGTVLTVSNARVLFRDVAFEAPATLSAKSSGTVAVAGTVGVTEIEAVNANGLELAGPLTRDIAFRCAGTSEVFLDFGFASTDLATAQASAARILNVLDDELGGEAYEGADGVKLCWGVRPVSDGDAVARMIVGGESVNYRSLRTLFKTILEDATVEILGNCVLSNAVTVSHALTIRAVDPEKNTIWLRNPGRTAPGQAFFTITGSGSVTNENVRLDGKNLTYGGCNYSVFYVGEGTELVLLGEGAAIANVPVVNEDLLGVIAVGGGRLEMRDGSEIVKCRARSTGSMTTSTKDVITAVNLYYGSFDFKGGQIVDGGNGIYAWSGPVNVSGSAIVTGNVDSDGNAYNVVVGDPETLVLAGDFTGRIGVSLLDAENELGEQFGVIDGGCASPEASAVRFFNDADPNLVGLATEDGRLVWQERPPEPPPVDWPLARVSVSGGAWVGFESVDEAFDYVEAFDSIDGGAVVELLADVYFGLGRSSPIRITHDVTLISAERNEMARFWGYLSEEGYISIESGGSLTVSNVVLNGLGDEVRVDSKFKSGNFLSVLEGGSLTLDDAVVTNVQAQVSDMTAAIAVSDGSLALRNGAEICDCRNDYIGDDDLPGAFCGGVLSFYGALDLAGGTIRDCSGAFSGGVYLLGDGSGVRVSGDLQLAGNGGGDLCIYDGTEVVLAGDFKGAVVVNEGEGFEDPNVFGTVDADYLATGEVKRIVNGAANFHREAISGDTGCVVTNASGSLLVWSEAVEDDVFVDKGGDTYWLLGRSGLISVDPPVAVEGLVYNGLGQTGVVAVAAGYMLVGNTATNAGTYTATATLAEGFRWSDGIPTADRTIAWSIAKAQYTLAEDITFVFTNCTFIYDGNGKTIFVVEEHGNWPEGIEVTYSGALQRSQPGGPYEVTAKFSFAEGSPLAQNYFLDIEPMTASYWIVKPDPPDPPDPPPEPPAWETVTNHPAPIAFKSIDRVSDTEWTLVITDRVEYCNYRLIWTTDLAKGFTSTGAWEQAVGEAAAPVWTTNVTTTGGAWFWRAEGADGTNMVPTQVEN